MRRSLARRVIAVLSRLIPTGVRDSVLGDLAEETQGRGDAWRAVHLLRVAGRFALARARGWVGSWSERRPDPIGPCRAWPR